MNGPQVTCSICQKTVSKRQTLSVGDGRRACREHGEAQQASQQLVQKQVQKSHAPIKPKWVRPAHAPLPLRPCCFICRCEGMRQDEFYTRLLIEQSKFEILNGHRPNLFDPEEMAKAASVLKGEKVLWWVRWEGANTKIKVPYNAYQVAQITGQLLACSDCCSKTGLKRATEEITENMSLERLAKLGAIMESLIDPVVSDIAQAELERDN